MTLKRRVNACFDRHDAKMIRLVEEDSNARFILGRLLERTSYRTNDTPTTYKR